MEFNRKETQHVATFRTVKWLWLCDELVDSCEREYKIFRRNGQLFVNLPGAEVEPLGQFLLTHNVGKRIRHIYRRLNHHRLEALDGATIDLYPRGSARVGLTSLSVEGGELNGLQC